MSRKHKHEDHVNHEAWAIPYGDLITLLLAFFVVMYSISSVNEGKYRTVSASLSAAFRGIPRTATPIAIGDQAALTDKQQSINLSDVDGQGSGEGGDESAVPESTKAAEEVTAMEMAVRVALQTLIESETIVVRKLDGLLEIEIRTDVLFGSGEAKPSTQAQGILKRVAAVLNEFENPVRVEGHTDNLPISNTIFASNWELSAGRAASVVRLLAGEGVDAKRLAVIGLGEHSPIAENESEGGRNKNRRVTLVIPASAPLDREIWDRAARSESTVLLPAS